MNAMATINNTPATNVMTSMASKCELRTRSTCGGMTRASLSPATEPTGLANCRQLAGDGRRLASLDQRRRPEIQRADTRERSDRRDNGGTQNANDHDLQMGRRVGAVKR